MSILDIIKYLLYTQPHRFGNFQLRNLSSSLWCYQHTCSILRCPNELLHRTPHQIEVVLVHPKRNY